MSSSRKRKASASDDGERQSKCRALENISTCGEAASDPVNNSAGRQASESNHVMASTSTIPPRVSLNLANSTGAESTFGEQLERTLIRNNLAAADSNSNDSTPTIVGDGLPYAPPAFHPSDCLFLRRIPVELRLEIFTISIEETPTSLCPESYEYLVDLTTNFIDGTHPLPDNQGCTSPYCMLDGKPIAIPKHSLLFVNRQIAVEFGQNMLRSCWVNVFFTAKHMNDTIDCLVLPRPDLVRKLAVRIDLDAMFLAYRFAEFKAAVARSLRAQAQSSSQDEDDDDITRHLDLHTERLLRAQITSEFLRKQVDRLKDYFSCMPNLTDIDVCWIINMEELRSAGDDRNELLVWEVFRLSKAMPNVRHIQIATSATMKRKFSRRGRAWIPVNAE
ncbi:hypothetical protein K402DRAFT_392319 [Aulographum hederae CBS 113979]|uniref:Uncharacterized protein n=1 Tax=Aulographum hederae CBS 113979 TaxID=1176131 RepID=A0A6G1H4R1_9PEZI|nr:hypothetical protein K402DRAFT_392319 [Aulographum hederae CBS 113979]